MQNSFDVGISFEMSLASELCFRHNSRVLGNFGLYSKVLQSESCTDLLVFSKKGLFVIEAKNFKTSLRGQINGGFWIGTSGTTGTKIYNVYLQNLLHIRLIKGFLRKRHIDVPKIFNIILVPDGCTVVSDYTGVMTVSDFHTVYATLEDVWNTYDEVFSIFETFQSSLLEKRKRRYNRRG